MKKKEEANIFEFACKSIDGLNNFKYNNSQLYDFSVVTAVYNSEKYLKESINSIVQQNGFNKIQLILVNDGSTDSSLSICKEYAKIYPNNIVVVNKPNGGVSSARNFGMLFVKGKFINFMDSDDKMGVNVFKNVKEFFEKNINTIDVVCIKVDLFGKKQGDSWFNKKFANGNRIINLWHEPTIYLNSVNNCFFHNRIKNQLYFDENINISEDLKVVNTTLMNKYKLGVMSTCLYHYRVGENDGSLVSTCKLKNDWYNVYLDRVFNWLYEKSVKQCGRFLDFLQYTLLRDLYNRFNENTECSLIMNTPEKLAEYKEKLFYAINCIDDNIILKNDFLNSDYQLYFLSIKHNSPVIFSQDDSVKFSWGNLSINKKLCVFYENISILDNKLNIEGYIILNNIRKNYKTIDVYFNFDNKRYNAEVIKEGNNDKIAFADEVVFTRKYFKASIPLNKQKNAFISCEVNLDNQFVNYNYVCYGKWCGLNLNTKNGYLYIGKYLLTSSQSGINISYCSKKNAKKREKAYQKELKNSNDKTARVSYYARKYYFLRKKFLRRQRWIISDRHNNAGDNGEELFRYMIKKHTHRVKYFFAIDKESGDYKKLRRLGKVLQLKTSKYKMNYLLADTIISSHLDNSELYPFNFKYLSDIFSKKKIVFLQHGVTKDDISKIYSRKQQKIDLFITCANKEYESIVNTESYFLEKNQVALTGFPRFDKLKSTSDKIILIMPTWRDKAVSFSSDITQVKVSPAFSNSYYYNYYHTLLNDERLHNIAKKFGYKLVYFPHNNMVPTNEYFSDIQNVYIVEGKDRVYSKYLSSAALLITDYSSTAFDFAYLRKPLIYCQGDREEFFQNHTYSKGYFDYDKDGFGEVVHNVQETINAIEKVLNNAGKCDNKYLTRIDEFFPFKDKHNSERVYKEILKLGEKR